MLKIYDKAQWHIDAGESKEEVVSRFKAVFAFLAQKGLLDAEGKEIFDLGIDSSVSIHERMMTDAGQRFMEDCYDDKWQRFMEDCYDEAIKSCEGKIGEALERAYKTFCDKQ